MRERERERERPDFRVDTDMAHQRKATDAYGNTNSREERINLNIHPEKTTPIREPKLARSKKEETISFSAGSEYLRPQPSIRSGGSH